jgi:hypothetical protein
MTSAWVAWMITSPSASTAAVSCCASMTLLPWNYGMKNRSPAMDCNCPECTGDPFPLPRGHLRLIYAIIFMGSCLATWFFH